MSPQNATDWDGSGTVGGTSPVVFHSAGGGLAVVDVIERSRYTLSTATGIDPAPTDAATFTYPVDAAVRIETDHVAVRGDVPATYVRDADWTMLAETGPPTDRRFPDGEYYVEICAPIKLFVHVEGPMRVEATTEGKRVSFDGERAVEVGAFSKHDRPAATVTTTGEPRDVMAAISTFGSALKTTSPERSFPNQRGHPPAVELGAEPSIPEGLSAPDTGVRIEVPPELRYVYPVATLAYYLGAEVVPGDRPLLATDAGLAHDLAPGGAFHREVERVLKGTFLLDCVTRTEGLYDLPLAERAALEPSLDLDVAALYDRPLAERLAAYLEVPYGTLEPHVPDWKLTADVAATPDSVETLPFVVDDLAVIRTDDPPRGSAGPNAREGGLDEQAEAVDSFVRGSAVADRSDETTDRSGEAVDSFVRSSSAVAAAPATLDLPAADSLERTWVGDGAVRGASKAMATAYRNRIERSPTEGDIDVTVVCNDREMLEERDVVEEVYGSTEDAPVDVSISRDLTTDELREVLASGAEFFHYIGHIDERGFECADGWFDAATLESTGVDAFLLNACTSYEQGTALIEAGAIGGIVTLAQVVNASAVPIGSTVARLLENGYPLRPAMEIARTTSYCADDYIVIGDGSVHIASGKKFIPNVHEVRREEDEFVLEILSYASVLGGMGEIFTPHLLGVDRYYLCSGTIDTFRVDERTLEEFLQLDDIPIVSYGTLYWPDEFEISALKPD